jgi:hypothetical protein
LLTHVHLSLCHKKIKNKLKKKKKREKKERNWLSFSTQGKRKKFDGYVIDEYIHNKRRFGD